MKKVELNNVEIKTLLEIHKSDNKELAGAIGDIYKGFDILNKYIKRDINHQDNGATKKELDSICDRVEELQMLIQSPIQMKIDEMETLLK